MMSGHGCRGGPVPVPELRDVLVIAVLLDPLEDGEGRSGGVLGDGLGRAVGVGDLGEVLGARPGDGDGVKCARHGADGRDGVDIEALAGRQRLALVDAESRDDGRRLFSLVDVLALEVDLVDLGVEARERLDLGQPLGLGDVGGGDALGVAIDAIGDGSDLADALEVLDALEAALLVAEAQALEIPEGAEGDRGVVGHAGGAGAGPSGELVALLRELLDPDDLVRLGTELRGFGPGDERLAVVVDDADARDLLRHALRLALIDHLQVRLWGEEALELGDAEAEIPVRFLDPEPHRLRRVEGTVPGRLELERRAVEASVAVGVEFPGDVDSRRIGRLDAALREAEQRGTMDCRPLRDRGEVEDEPRAGLALDHPQRVGMRAGSPFPSPALAEHARRSGSGAKEENSCLEESNSHSPISLSGIPKAPNLREDMRRPRSGRSGRPHAERRDEQSTASAE